MHGCILLDNADGTGSTLLDNADGTGSTLLDNAGAYYPEQLVTKKNALYLMIFSTYKVDHIFNAIGITA